MAWIDDYTINNTIRTVRHTSGTTVYSVNVQYSAIKDYEDDPANMTHPVIMEAQTPTEYTMTNGWFIDNISTEFLNGGAITTIGYVNEIQRVVTTNAGTDPIASDLGKVVTPATTGTAGELLHFDLDINDDASSVNAWYVRSGDTTAYTGAMTIAAGTGAQTPSTSVDGEEIWTNVFSFGVITSTVSPQFYIEQVLNGADHRIIEWVANSNFSRGNMDVLIRTQVEGATSGLDALLITIRQPGTTYDSSEQTLNGGRNPFALNAADDPDNLLAEYYFLFDGEAGTDIAVGDDLTADSKAWYCEVIEVAYFAATTTGYVGVRGLNESRDALVDGDAFTSSGGGTAVTNGSAGDRIIAYDTQVSNFTTIPQIITGGSSLTKSNLKGVQDVAATGYLVLQNDALTGGIDFAEDSTYYNTYTDGENITGATDGDADVDLTGGGTSLDKQLAVSGMDGKVEIVWHHGEITVDGGHSLAIGMHVTQAVSGETGVVTDVTGNVIGIGNTSADFQTSANSINDDDSGATGANPTGWVDDHTVSKAFQQATNKNYDALVFMESETVQRSYDYTKYRTGDGNEQQMNKLNTISASLIRTPVDGQFYLSAYVDEDAPANTYDKVGKRAAPIGTFAGGTWFTARGIWLQDVSGADAIKFQLIDSDNVVQNPPNFVQIVSGDRVGVYEDDGGGLVKKDTYNSDASANVQGDVTFEVDGTPAIRLDAPSAGWVIVTDDDSTSGQVREHAYFYNSFTGNIFTLDVIATSTGTAGAGGLTHTNSGRDFGADGVLPGYIVRNVTDGSIGIVDTVGTTTFTVKQLEGGAGNNFDTSDVVEINELVVTYVAADTAFTPYINETSGGTTTSVTVIFVTDRTLLGKTRNKGVIFAVDAAATLNSGGASIPTVRTTDTIAT